MVVLQEILVVQEMLVDRLAVAAVAVAVAAQ